VTGKASVSFYVVALLTQGATTATSMTVQQHTYRDTDYNASRASAHTQAPAAATSSIKKIMFTFPSGMAIRYSSFDLYDSNNNNVLSAFTDGGLTASSGNTVYVGQIVDGVCAGSKASIGGSAGGDSGVYRWFDDCGTSGTDWITSTGATDYRCKSWCHPWIDLFNSGANACLLLTFASPVSGAFTDAVVAGYSPEVTNKASTIVHVAYDNAPDTFVEVGSETNPSITAMGQSECGYPTSAYKIPLTVQATTPIAGGAGAGASAVGDPHLQNVYGQRFDLMKAGKHVLINIPRGAAADSALLRVQADAHRMGGQCADMYFQQVNVTGSWAEAKKAGGYHYSVSQHDAKSPEWIAFGKVELKVVHGRTDSGLLYLNLYVKHLGRAGFAVGGLLGEDDHEDVSAAPDSCAQRLALVDGSQSERSLSAVSVAVASFE